MFRSFAFSPNSPALSRRLSLDLRRRRLGLQRSHVDGEAILHIGLEQSLVGFVDLLDWDDFDIGGDVVCPTEVEHLLGFGNAANRGAGQTATAHEQAEGRDGERLFRCADERNVAVAAEQVEVGVDVVVGGDGVEDEVEAAGVLLHLIGIARDHDFVGTEAERVRLLTGRGREDDHIGSEGMGELHAHVAQPAETDHANLLTLGNSPVAHRGVRCDAGAEERCRSGKIEVGGNAQNESLIDDDAIGVATIGDASEVLIGAIVGEGHVRAELLKALPAMRACVVGVDHATDRDEVG